MMKHFKPIYIYLSGIALLVVLFYLMNSNINISSSKNNPEVPAPPAEEINGMPLPNDNIHNKLKQNPIAQKPSKSNVMSSIMEHMKELKKSVEEHPNDTLKIRQYADFLAEAHQKDKAVFYYDKILKVNPRRVDILSSLVYLNFNDNNLNGAEKYVKKILSIDKNNLNARYNLGVIYANKGNKMKAEQTWESIIKKFPTSRMAKKAKESVAKL